MIKELKLTKSSNTFILIILLKTEQCRGLLIIVVPVLSLYGHYVVTMLPLFGS